LMDVEGLLAEEASGWAVFADVLARVPEARFEEPTLPAGWSPKDVVFHVARWMETAADVLDRIEAGTYRPRDFEDADGDNRRFVERMNAEWVERGRAIAAQAVRARLEPARDAMRRAFGVMSAVTPAAWEWFEESGPRHYAAHLPDLRAWLGS
jgi:Mycothiol maleylpyruvate isomerase N-terminal domain